MKTAPLTPAELAGSVVAVPPLALTAKLDIAVDACRKLVAHVEAGGVSTILWGGNAQIQHWPSSRYGELLAMAEETAGRDSRVLPSVGPSYGKLMDEAAVLAGTRFPCAMALPMPAQHTPEGVAAALRAFVQRAGKPLVAYIRSEDYLAPDDLAAMVAAGEVVAVKYAVARKDPAVDPYLTALCAAIGRERIASGSGELLAVPHLRHFGLVGFTAGCVCIAPRLSTGVLAALKSGDEVAVERHLRFIRPLESLRERINLIRVLHDAVTISGIADMGPILPMLSPTTAAQREEIARAVAVLLEGETALTGGGRAATN